MSTIACLPEEEPSKTSTFSNSYTDGDPTIGIEYVVDEEHVYVIGVRDAEQNFVGGTEAYFVAKFDHSGNFINKQEEFSGCKLSDLAIASERRLVITGEKETDGCVHVLNDQLDIVLAEAPRFGTGKFDGVVWFNSILYMIENFTTVTSLYWFTFRDFGEFHDPVTKNIWSSSGEQAEATQIEFVDGEVLAAAGTRSSTRSGLHVFGFDRNARKEGIVINEGNEIIDFDRQDMITVVLVNEADNGNYPLYLFDENFEEITRINTGESLGFEFEAMSVNYINDQILLTGYRFNPGNSNCSTEAIFASYSTTSLELQNMKVVDCEEYGIDGSSFFIGKRSILSDGDLITLGIVVKNDKEEMIISRFDPETFEFVSL